MNLRAVSMDALRVPVDSELSSTEYDVILGPCPGCWMWQVDYTDDVEFFYDDTTPWTTVIENVLHEHLDECPHLRQLLEEYR